jgi:hypothetical protein
VCDSQRASPVPEAARAVHAMSSAEFDSWLDTMLTAQGLNRAITDLRVIADVVKVLRKPRPAERPESGRLRETA